MISHSVLPKRAPDFTTSQALSTQMPYPMECETATNVAITNFENRMVVNGLKRDRRFSIEFTKDDVEMTDADTNSTPEKRPRLETASKIEQVVAPKTFTPTYTGSCFGP